MTNTVASSGGEGASAIESAVKVEGAVNGDGSSSRLRGVSIDSNVKAVVDEAVAATEAAMPVSVSAREKGEEGLVGEKKQENVESKDDVKCATVEPAADSTKEEDEKAAPTIPTVKKEEMETNTAAASSGTPLGIIAPKPKRSADVMKADAAIEQHESDDDAQEINGLICRGRKFRAWIPQLRPLQKS